MQRNAVISIAKGIAIILMVAGHAEGPELMTNFIYTFHMPLFFITAGYFFTPRHAAEPWEFCRRRVKGLYIPFLKWSIVFLLLHNLFFSVGLLNEQYGNWTGGVTHPYDWHAFSSRLLSIVTSMSGYDEFLAGAFWFFRGLLLASVIFLVIYRLIDRHTRMHGAAAAAIVCLAALAFNAFRIANGLKISVIPNGGLREIWGVFFFGIGMIFRNIEPRLKLGWPVGLASFFLLCIAAVMHLSGMNNVGRLRDLWSLPITGSIGFVMVYIVSKTINSHQGKIRDLLVFLGENTLYIFVFHIISFKVVSALKILYYDLDTAQIGCHMVIHYNHTDFFWVLYTIAGVGIPVAGRQFSRWAKKRLVLLRADRKS